MGMTTAQTMLELAACPCCESSASHACEDGVWHLVRCTNRKCGMQSGIFPTKPWAFRIWNTRASQPAAVREALEPFAKAAAAAAWPTYEGDTLLINESFGVTVGDLRKARAALRSSQPAAQAPRECATCHAILAEGPQPAATYEADAGTGMTYDTITEAFDQWRKTLTVVDRPSNQEIFSQGYVAGWSAKEAPAGTDGDRERIAGIDEEDHMQKISALIARLQSTMDRFGDTCVYIRRGGMAWGAVALNRRDDDRKNGVFDLQAQHDRDMQARLEQVERLIVTKNEWMERAMKVESAIAISPPQVPDAVREALHAKGRTKAGNDIGGI